MWQRNSGPYQPTNVTRGISSSTLSLIGSCEGPSFIAATGKGPFASTVGSSSSSSDGGKTYSSPLLGEFPTEPVTSEAHPYSPQARARRRFRYRLPVQGRVVAVLGQRLQQCSFRSSVYAETVLYLYNNYMPLRYHLGLTPVQADLEIAHSDSLART
ncbi:hypothetical protein Taro_025012 [Colocasia esculenta]|uniref:Uncharacterized protein n=1 Tax=Colocasia esculenta TaxID=4460 RepID=A0A843VCY5_COLES|nr:hypothetical protein [Colocasia esculenta]